MSRPAFRWAILDSWTWNPSDRAAAEAWQRAQRGNFDGAQVRLYPRTVRAGGARVALLVGVVRRKVARDP